MNNKYDNLKYKVDHLNIPDFGKIMETLQKLEEKQFHVEKDLRQINIDFNEFKLKTESNFSNLNVTIG
jgi:hypothetical protein